MHYRDYLNDLAFGRKCCTRGLVFFIINFSTINKRKRERQIDYIPYKQLSLLCKMPFLILEDHKTFQIHSGEKSSSLSKNACNILYKEKFFVPIVFPLPHVQEN